MVRGMGKTEGYYERTVPLKKKTFTAAFGDSRRLPGAERNRLRAGSSRSRTSREFFVTRSPRSQPGGETQDISPDKRARAISWGNRLSDYADERFL